MSKELRFLFDIKKSSRQRVVEIERESLVPFYAGPNLTPALITPEANFGLTPIRAAYYAKEKGWSKNFLQ